ncbi:hypothetical protein [Absidia glauca]|uniref:SUN domain-containing protein n=1 Tax=Absidia glauca TaxID=4829 RepID=A0A163K1Z2_ABSGL|nr:hypothetical protein [Absidia glauca]
MTDYSSPIPRRRDLYSTLFNEHLSTPPPADNALRDTTVNVATAFSNAEQQQKQQPYSIATRSPSRSLSGVGTGPHIDTSYLMSPSKRFSMARRDTDQYGTLVDSDNDFFEFKPMEDFGRQHSSFSQRSSSDDDDDPYQEEEFLAYNPGEEELRRNRITGRQYTMDGSQAGSFHSLFSRISLDTQDTVDNTDNVPIHQSSPIPSTSPPIILALERVFKSAMLCIFMVFWLVRKLTVAFITFVLVIVVKIFINPLVYLLQSIGFRSLTFPTPLTLSAGDSPSSSFHWIWSVLLLAVPSLWYLYPDIGHSIRSLSLPTYQLPHWTTFTPSATIPGDGDPLMMHRVVTLENTVHGLVEHMQKQDTNSKQQFSSINWYLDQLQTQLTQWTASQSKVLEISLEDQIDKVENVLASTTTEWNNRLMKPESQDGSTVVSPKLVDALRQTFVSKSDLGDNTMHWDDMINRHQDSIDQYVQGVMDQYIQEQRRLGKWLDMDTLISQMMQPGVMPTETSNLVRGWIDAAVERYYQDLTRTPDYALSTRGGMVIHSLTSPTFSSLDNTDTHWWAKLYAGWTQPTISPVIALTPGIHTGQCWPMKGSHGSLGIKLSERINVQGITVEYPSQPSITNKISSAPKRMDIWGIQDLNAGFSMDSHDNDNHSNSIYLGTITYDVHAQPAQTFPITTNRFITFEGVVVRVLSNWGNQEYTCLCRVGVHGTTEV